jgi:hypothetical protein
MRGRRGRVGTLRARADWLRARIAQGFWEMVSGAQESRRRHCSPVIVITPLAKVWRSWVPEQHCAENRPSETGDRHAGRIPLVSGDWRFTKFTPIVNVFHRRLAASEAQAGECLDSGPDVCPHLEGHMLRARRAPVGNVMPPMPPGVARTQLEHPQPGRCRFCKSSRLSQRSS